MAGVSVSLRLALALAAALAACGSAEYFVVPPAQLQAAPYAEWAHYHWIWLSADDSNQTSMQEFVQGFLERGIPVGAVDIDSDWETEFNNFVVDTARFPDMKAMVEDFHAQSIRVVLWITSFVNTDTSIYQQGLEGGYYVRNALQKPAVFKWWHGEGSLVDLTSPPALAWWQAMVDPILALGIDGWKCDGSDPFIIEAVVPHSANGSRVTYREYADAYYRFFFEHTRAVNGEECLIMSRPVDGWDPIWLAYSPRDVVFSGWVGDQDPTFHGLEEALKRYLQSAWAGYVGWGSDIGGYRNGQRTKELFLRWAQLGAFSPLMENGGNNDHRPWSYDTDGSNETTATYLKFVTAHMELAPYLLSAGTTAFAGNGSIITPLCPHNTTAEKLAALIHPATYNYLLGQDLLVAPIYSNVTEANVTFPAEAEWVDYWEPSRVFPANSSIVYNCPLTSYPVFQRAGSVLPLRVTNELTGGRRGDAHSADALTLLFARPLLDDREHATSVHQWKSGGFVIAYRGDEATLEVTVTAQPQPLLLRLQGLPVRPVAVFDHAGAELPLVADTTALAAAGSSAGAMWIDAKTGDVAVRPAGVERGVRLRFSFKD